MSAKSIRILERRIDFLAKKIAEEDKARPPLTWEREEIKALKLAIAALDKQTRKETEEVA